VELGIPMVLVLNMIDEAEDRGIEIDAQRHIRGFSQFPSLKRSQIYGKGKKAAPECFGEHSKTGESASCSLCQREGYSGTQRVASPAFLSVEWLAENTGTSPGLSRVTWGKSSSRS